MNYLLYILTVCIGGSTWFAITYQLENIPLDLSIFYRFGLASLIIFMWSFFKRKNLIFSWPTHSLFVAQGFFLFSMNYIAAYAAGLYIPSGLNALGFSMILFFNVINSFLFFRIPLTSSVAYGGLSGVVGITTIFWPSIFTLDLSNDSIVGIILSLLASLFASFGTMISLQNQKREIPVLQSNAYAMGYGALIMLGIIYFKDIPFQFDFSYKYTISLLYLAVVGSVVIFGCYLTLLGRIGPNKASYALIMAPVIAIILSTLFENFVWNLYTFVGVGLMLGGNIIILARTPKGSKNQGDNQVLTIPAFKEAL